MQVLDEFVRVEIAIGDEPYILIPTWVDITADVRDLSWGYSRQGPTGQASPATMSVTVENAGKYDPSSGLGGATWATKMKRWLQIRVTISSNDFFTSTPKFRGHIYDVTLSDDPVDNTARIEAVGVLGILAEVNLEDEVRSEELSGVRVSAILDAAGIPGGFSSREDTGTVVLAAETLSGQCLQAAQECARSEGGLLWETQNGLIMSTDRHYFYDTFSRSSFALAASDIKYGSIPKTLRAFENVNVGAVSNSTGAVRKFGTTPANNPTTERRELNTKAIWNADSSSLARWLVRQSNFFGGSRVGAVRLDVLRESDTTVLDGLVANTLKWLDTVVVTYTAAHGFETVQECWIESERHTVNRNGVWVLELGLSPYGTGYQVDSGDFYVYGTTVTADHVGGY